MQRQVAGYVHRYGSMTPLQYDLKCLCDRNRDGSHATQAARRKILDQAARELRTLGFRDLRAPDLKPRHVERLLARWQAEQLSAGTLKNRLAHLRWWAEKVGRRSVIPRDNARLGIAQRVYVDNTRQLAQAFVPETVAQIPDAHLRLSLELQALFGLRRAEALKFQPALADRGDHLALKASWCKGGRAREIPVRTAEQRELLTRVHALAGAGSLIPAHLSYVEQLHRYEHYTRTAGLSRLHGLRHQYAQTRYRELTGWPAPAAGGRTAAELTPGERALDRTARLQISSELGHARELITVVYLGR